MVRAVRVSFGVSSTGGRRGDTERRIPRCSMGGRLPRRIAGGARPAGSTAALVAEAGPGLVMMGGVRVPVPVLGAVVCGDPPPGSEDAAAADPSVPLSVPAHRRVRTVDVLP